MKVLMITPYFYPSVGGVQNYALHIAQGLQKEGHEVLIVTSNHAGNSRVEDKVEGLRIIRLPRLLKISNTPINPLWRGQLKQIIKTEKPDVINAHMPVPFIADMAERVRGRTPFVLTYHNDLIKTSLIPNLAAQIYNTLFTRKTLRRSDKIIATSQYYADKSPYLKKWSNKIAIVSPGVDTARFNTKVDKTWLKKKYPNKKIVLFVGSMEKTHQHKGVDVLLKAVAQAQKQIPNIQMVAVGSGDAIPIYIEQARQLGIADSVDFPGFATDKDLPKYYAGADVFVLPSTSDAEGFGMVLAEAQACGTPVIATQVGGVSSAICEKSMQRLVDAGSAEALSAALISHLKRKHSPTHISRHIEENLMWSRQAEKFYLIASSAMRSREIVCVIPTYPPKLGGMELAAQSLNYCLVQEGFKVQVITSNIGETTKAVNEGDNNIEVSRLRAKEIAHSPVIPGLFGKLIKLPSNSIVHLHISQAITPEIALAAAKVRRLPLVVHLHTDVGPSGPAGVLLPMYKKFFLKAVLRGADHILVLNNSYKQLLVEKYRLDDNRINVVPNGVDGRFFNKKPKKVSNEVIKLLYVGRLSIEKNLPMIIDAVAGVEASVQLDIVGDGPLMKALRKQADAVKGKKIVFHGFQSANELVKYYQSADALVLASDYEGQPTVVMEAMASGTPVIGTNVIGINDAIGQDGLIVEKNTQALVAGITKFATDPKLRLALAKKAQKRASQFSWEPSIKSLKKIYASL